MNRRAIVVLLALALAEITINAQTATVNYSGGADYGSRTVEDSTGALLGLGNYVEIGYFNSGFNVAQNAQATHQALVNLGNNWNLFGSTTIAQNGIATQNGEFATSSTLGNAAFNGQPINLWIFKTSNNGAPLADYSNVIEYGLFTGPNTSWVFPSTTSSPPNNRVTITTGDVGLQAFAGTIIGGASSGFLQLEAVPSLGV